MKITKEEMKEYIAALSKEYALYQVFTCAFILFLVVYIVDYYDYLSKIMYKLELPVFIIVLVATVLICTMLIIHSHVKDLFKIMEINTLDFMLLLGMIGDMIYIAVVGVTGISRWYKIILSLILIVIFSLSFHKRIVIRRKAENVKHSNLHDLMQIYENNIKAEKGMPILVQETDVEYDLFKRDDIINQLYRSITYAEPEKSYVISLEGAWGTGKTTIINNVKKLIADDWNADDYIIIDDFDPWLYGSQEALLYAMYDTLLSHLQISYSTYTSKKLIDGILGIVAEEHVAGNLLYRYVSVYNDSIENVNKLKGRISTLIQTSDKKIVFIIDNLDRASDSNIIFLFKLISLVFDLPRIVYVLAFEKERIEKVLNETQEFNSRFTEKIIQQEITVYPIEKEQLKRIYSECVFNLLIAYGEPINRLEEYKSIVDVLVKETPNLRAFKRIINTIFTQVFCDNRLLNRRDLLGVEVIRFLNLELYMEIQKHRDYLVSYERSSLENTRIGFKMDAYNAKGKEVLSALVEKYAGYIELLKELFPNVKRVLRGENITTQYNKHDEQRDSIQKARISNAQCFDLYFSYGSNRYVQIKKEIVDAINQINTAENYDEIDSIIQRLLRQSSYDKQEDWINSFYNHIDRIYYSKRADVATALIQNVRCINNTLLFLERNAYDGVIMIVRDLITMCSDNEIDNLLVKISSAYQALSMIGNIASRLKSKVVRESLESRGIEEKFYNLYEKMCDEVIKSNINLYDTEIYLRKNVWALYRYCMEKDLAAFQKYIHLVVSKENVYKILGDVIDDSIGSEYIYTFRKVNFDLFSLEESKVDALLQEKTAYTEAEHFVYSIYRAYRNRNIDKESSAESYRDEAIVWDL